MGLVDDLMALTTVMEMNAGVLRQRDHLASRSAFDHLRRTGAIVRVLPGTFVDARLLADRRTRFAAALAAAPGSLLWGECAVGAITRTLGDSAFAADDVVHLAHAHYRQPRRGIRWVRRAVPAEHRVRVGGLRCPSAAYLAAEASVRDEGELIERFLREGRMVAADLAAVLPAFDHSAGQIVRRGVVRTSLDNPWSGGERRLQELLRRARVTGWVANAELVVDDRLFFPDLYFADARLVVEFDGFAVHTRPEVFESDRVRQNVLVLAGYTVLRYTWKQLVNAPDAVVGQIVTTVARETARHCAAGAAQ